MWMWNIKSIWNIKCIWNMEYEMYVGMEQEMYSFHIPYSTYISYYIFHAHFIFRVWHVYGIRNIKSTCNMKFSKVSALLSFQYTITIWKRLLRLSTVHFARSKGDWHTHTHTIKGQSRKSVLSSIHIVCFIGSWTFENFHLRTPIEIESPCLSPRTCVTLYSQRLCVCIYVCMCVCVCMYA